MQQSSPETEGGRRRQLDDNNRKLFEEFEKKLRCLAREGSFEVDQRDYIYLKNYTLHEKINAKFWEIFERHGPHPHPLEDTACPTQDAPL